MPVKDLWGAAELVKAGRKKQISLSSGQQPRVAALWVPFNWDALIIKVGSNTMASATVNTAEQQPVQRRFTGSKALVLVLLLWWSNKSEQHMCRTFLWLSRTVLFLYPNWLMSKKEKRKAKMKAQKFEMTIKASRELLRNQLWAAFTSIKCFKTSTFIWLVLSVVPLTVERYIRPSILHSPEANHR